MAINLLGGINLPKNKENLEDNDILEIRPPEHYSVPILTTNGFPMEECVSVGDYVKEGSLLAKPTTAKGSFVYSPTSGKVVSIIDKLTSTGLMCKHIVIKDDKNLDTTNFEEMEDLSAKELLKRLAVSGIVDANFGGSPTYLRYTLNAVEKQFTLYVLMSNTDPYLTANEALTLHRTAEVVSGAKYFAKILNSNKIVFLFTAAAKQARKKLKAFIKQNEPELDYEIKIIENRYPLDHVDVLQARFKPKKNIFVEQSDKAKFFIEDAITCHNFYNAVKNNAPINYRIITVGGNNIVRKGNYIVKNGTSFEHVLEVVGVKDGIERLAVINGGIMRGTAQYTLDVSCDMETLAITFIDDSEYKVQDEMPCINCGRCVDVCPMNLLPHKIDEQCINRKTYPAKQLGIDSCIGCGCCSNVCPSKRYITQRLIKTKKELGGSQ